MTAGFWEAIDHQLADLRTARTADAVFNILDGGTQPGAAFFAGGGGDGSVEGSLVDAGWSHVWRQAHYYWCMVAPNGDVITYVEGDVYRGNQAVPR